MSALIKAFWKPLTLIALVASLLWGFGHLRYNAGKAVMDSAWSLKWSQRNEADATERAAKEATERAEESRRQQASNEEQKHAEQELAKVRADGLSAQRAADGLQQQLTQLQRQFGRSETGRLSAVAANSQAKSEATILLAQLLSESDDLAGKFAREADENYVAGSSCERTYDKVTGIIK